MYIYSENTLKPKYIHCIYLVFYTVVDCGDPPELDNGTVISSPLQTTVDSIVMYQCIEGFVLILYVLKMETVQRTIQYAVSVCKNQDSVFTIFRIIIVSSCKNSVSVLREFSLYICA